MITKVEIKNFASHKDSIFEFVPGVNVIIGVSDQGKSAVFNAINWVVSNRPLGDAFRSKWGGDTEVTIYTDDGHIIKRLRTNAINEYILDGVVLSAFGTGVPEEVTNILQLDTHNIQGQFDPYFLLSYTPGEAAKLLNKAASIDIIDQTISFITKDINRINSDIKYHKEKEEELTQSMDEYNNLPIIEKAIEKAENLESERNSINDRLINLKHLINKIRQVKIKLEKTKHIPTLLEKLEGAEKLHDSYQKEITKIEKLKQLISNIKRTIISIDRSEKEIKRLTQEYQSIIPEECPICGGKMK